MSKKSFLSIEDILSSPSAGQLDSTKTSRMTITDEHSLGQSESSSPLAHNIPNTIVGKLINFEENKNFPNHFSGIKIPGANSALATNLNALMEAVSAVGPGMCQKLSPISSEVSPVLNDLGCHGDPVTPPTPADHHLSLLWNTSKTGSGGNPDMTAALSPERHPNFLLSLQRKQQNKRELNSRRQRTSFTAEQTIKLELEFQMNEYITRSRRFELADLLGLSENQIKIWYQNRRAKDKRIEKAHLESNIRRQLNQLAFGGSNPFGLLPSPASTVNTFAEELRVLDRLVSTESLAAEKFQLMANLQLQNKPTLVQSITANNHMTAKSMLENSLSFL